MTNDLVDRQRIADTVFKYARCLDEKNWGLMAEVFTDEIDMDFSDLTGTPPGRASANAFISFASGALAKVDTQHLIANPKIIIDGDEAVCVVDHQSMHHRVMDGTAAFFNLHGTYELILKRGDNDWKISGLRQTVRFTVGDKTVIG